MAIAQPNPSSPDAREAQWPELRRRTARRKERRNLRKLWPEACGDGTVLRWGIEVATGDVPPDLGALSRIAGGAEIPTDIDLAGSAEELIERLGRAALDMETLATALAWAYAMPELAVAPANSLPEDLWWELLNELQATQRGAIEQADKPQVQRLIAGGELGAVLAWRLPDLPSCAAAGESSLQSIADWFDESGASVAAAVAEGGRWARVALASALRCRRLSARMQRRISIRRAAVAVDLAAWVAALLRTDGSAALGEFRGKPQGDLDADGLLRMAAREVGGPSLHKAFDASLGLTKSDGRLAWTVELPEPGWFDDQARLAVMLPEWDVRRGRVAIDYSGPGVRLEISGGKRPLVCGDWGIELRLEGQALQPTGDWTDICWHSDDDVHYLEIERSYGSGLKVQRQVMLLRDDHCVMLADAVLGGGPGQSIEYKTSLPLAPTALVEQEGDTREMWLVDGKPRALLLPLGLNEWRIGPAPGNLLVVDPPLATEGEPTGLRIESSMRSEVALYAPLWFDLNRKRIRQPRTWRRLSVGESLRLVPANQAAAFRVHSGADQWLVYRSLNGQRNRTFLGKNLISDFFCGRFDSEDGSIEEMIAVDEQPD